jgi:hypothetical protein
MISKQHTTNQNKKWQPVISPIKRSWLTYSWCCLRHFSSHFNTHSSDIGYQLCVNCHLIPHRQYAHKDFSVHTISLSALEAARATFFLSPSSVSLNGIFKVATFYARFSFWVGEWTRASPSMNKSSVVVRFSCVDTVRRQNVRKISFEHLEWILWGF